MLIRDGSLRVGGEYTIRKWRDGVLVAESVVPNLITNGMLNILRDGLKGDVTDIQIKYMEWGSGSTAPTTGDVALQAPLGRKQVTDRTVTGDGLLTTTVQLAPDEANDPAIEEWAFYLGAGATAAIGTGILGTRILSSQSKTNLESFTVDYASTLEEKP